MYLRVSSRIQIPFVIEYLAGICSNADIVSCLLENLKLEIRYYPWRRATARFKAIENSHTPAYETNLKARHFYKEASIMTKLKGGKCKTELCNECRLFSFFNAAEENKYDFRTECS